MMCTPKGIPITENFWSIGAVGEVFYPPEFQWDKVEEIWKAPVMACLQAMKSVYREQVGSVYLRGSIPLGRGIPQVSDIDLILLLNEDQAEQASALRDKLQAVENRYEYISSIDMSSLLSSELGSFPTLFPMIKLYGLCLYGKEVVSELPPITVGPGCHIHFPALEKDYEKFESAFHRTTSQPQRETLITWISKRILRAHAEWLTPVSRQHTRDLFSCYRLIQSFDADLAELAQRGLIAAIEPSALGEELSELRCYCQAIVSKERVAEKRILEFTRFHW